MPCPQIRHSVLTLQPQFSWDRNTIAIDFPILIFFLFSTICLPFLLGVSGISQAILEFLLFLNSIERIINFRLLRWRHI